ncbi:MAG: PDZ domain-containing protein [Candidatus Neomarinimicrobiota bacterium]
MKTYTKILMNLLLAVLIAMPIVVFAQDNLEEKAEELGDRMEQWGTKMEAWGNDIEEAIENGDISAPPSPFSNYDDNDYDSGPRLGAFVDDMDFEDAYIMHYPYCYGVYVDDISIGGNAHRAGLVEGDIIMEFDDEKVRFEDHLLQLRDAKTVGDTVKIKVFRNEKEIETLLTFKAPEQEKHEEWKELDRWEKPEWGKSGWGKKDKLHPGFGGGGPEVILLNADLDIINNLLQANGFDDLTETTIPLFGGFGMGNVGNGWFIGGAGYGYEKIQKLSIGNGTRRYEYKIGFGGMTINKKIAVLENVVIDLGLLVGWGHATLELRQTDGDYSWNDSFDDNPNYYSLKYRKRFFAYHPSAGVLIRLLPWLGVRGSVGYLGSYAFNDDWEDDYFSYTVKGDSPKVLDGLSYSLGVWFGY